MQQKHIEKHRDKRQLRMILNYGTASQRRLAHQCLDLLEINENLVEILKLEEEIEKHGTG
jgi:hypothetical protein